MIALEAVTAKAKVGKGRPPAQVRGVSLVRTGGVLSVIGTPGDGTSLLLALFAGRVPPKSGRAIVGGKLASEATHLVAHVPLDATLPEIMRVDEVCSFAAEVRGEPASDRLGPLGLDALAKRPVRSLSPGEVRAVALAIALGSTAKVLLVEEPLASLEPAIPSRVVEAIRARASAGTIVVVTTASVRDATKLGDDLAVLTQGVLAPLAPGLAHVGAEGARLRVVVPSAGLPAIVGAITEDPAVASVETVTYADAGRGAILVAGTDLVAIAAAVASASERTAVDVEAIESAVVPLDAIRAALATPRQPALPSVPPPAPAAPPPPQEGAA